MCRNDSGQNTPVGGHLRSEYVSDRWVNIQESRKNNHTSKGVSLLRNGGVNLKRNRGVNMVRNLQFIPTVRLGHNFLVKEFLFHFKIVIIDLLRMIYLINKNNSFKRESRSHI